MYRGRQTPQEERIQATSPQGDLNDAMFRAMCRHNAKLKNRQREATGPNAAPGGGGGDDTHEPPKVAFVEDGSSGDICYGAWECAEFVFGEATDKTRGRIFDMFEEAKRQREDAEQNGEDEPDVIPLFKAVGTIWLSKTEFRAWIKRQSKTGGIIKKRAKKRTGL